MLSVSELLNQAPLPGNYFAPDAYVQGDFELGLLENRQGNRLIALPDTLLEALYSSLEEEVGPAASLVMFQCGRWWGKYFYRRFAEEVSTYYGKPLAEMEMVTFLQCLKQCWKTYGWGILNLDFSYYRQGFIVATITNSAFAKVCQRSKQPPEQPSCHMEAGLLSTFLSQLTGQELHCVQTACESMGAASNVFILGLAERVKVAEACLEEKQDHDTIMMRLGLTPPAQ
ncbi:MAG: V4R domain-containing protein [Thermosynechococcaceae cyanobacterium]